MSLYKKLIIGLLTVVSIQTSKAQEKPNVLVILADDLGYGDLGFTGSKEIFTPNIDKLANNGVVFNNGYVTHPYCGPSRAGLVTGRYQARFGLEINLTNSQFDMYNGLPLSEQTFAKRLHQSGYNTGAIGKWHLGGSDTFHPNNRGFDYFYGFLSGGHSYFPKNVKTHMPLINPKNGKPHYSANEGSYWPLIRNDQAGEFNEYLTTALSKDAAKFIKNSEKPFCLYLAYNAPHLPLEAPKETIEKYSHIKDKKRRTYAAMIDELDQGVGIVIEELKRTGKYDNTLIFFLSDNGGPRKNGEKFASNGNFREGKGSMYEGGCHVPFFLHWPNGNFKIKEFDGLVSALDIAATSVALGKGDVSGHALEGKNLIPYLTGKQKGSPHEALYWRMQDGTAWGVRTPDTKFLKLNKKTAKPELFDMKKDPFESIDIISKNPKKRAEMAKLWNDWNQNNKSNIYLQSGDYQKKRLNMYKKMYEDLEKKAAKKELLKIE
ncbi:arylsulfatase A-like enzyme [Wenyingzhuangia heitensis]|uniref:Arylsulfatase A-like enzyme n=1 Tax=Wenyingzhuangia heitensis TaxID=1487859 RepID=A0ABX0UC38_9FLAO|nr:sulfatase-like hydrolase/transferase [Wenyingzhuangia heitensis]NIJ45909.1 arylsulfatase A-like enzyme [Wenyingzhuangia heitensis]